MLPLDEAKRLIGGGFAIPIGEPLERAVKKPREKR